MKVRPEIKGRFIELLKKRLERACIEKKCEVYSRTVDLSSPRGLALAIAFVEGSIGNN